MCVTLYERKKKVEERLVRACHKLTVQKQKAKQNNSVPPPKSSGQEIKKKTKKRERKTSILFLIG